MIIFHSITYKNFESVGEHPIKIQLDKHQTTVVGGLNGSGKSTVLHALTYALFGTVLKDIKLAGLINMKNGKGLVTEVEFSTRGNKYKIIRGQKPNRLELYINDEIQDARARATDTQKQINSILGMDAKLFGQMIVLDKEKFKPFMDLTGPERRKIVEDLLNINVFSEMVVEANTEYRTVTNAITDLTYKKEKLVGQKDAILKIMKEESEMGEEAWNKIQLEIDKEVKRAEEVQALIDEKSKALNELSGTVNVGENQNKVKSLNKKIREASNIMSTFKSKIKTFSDEIDFYHKNDNCPICKSELDDEFKKTRVSELESNKNIHEEQLVQLEETIKTIESQRDNLEALLTEHQSQKHALDLELATSKQSFNGIVSLLKNLKQQQDSLKASGIDHQSKIDELDKEIDELAVELEVLLTEQQELDKIKQLLKDDGIKSIIIDDHLDFINMRLNEYLHQMGFFISITIDKTFEATVNSVNRDGLVYGNLSSGQKLRVNLSLWLALLEMASMKNAVATNLCILDEILEPLDSDGVQNVLSLFKDKMIGKNIFVITQRQKEFRDYFHSEINFTMNNGFTEMVK